MEGFPFPNGDHLAEYPDLFPLNGTYGSGKDPAATGKCIEGESHLGIVPAGNHQVRNTVSGEVVDAYHHFPAAPFQGGTRHQTVARSVKKSFFIPHKDKENIANFAKTQIYVLCR